MLFTMRCVPALAGFVLAGLTVGTAAAQPVHESYKLTSLDGAAGDYFGTSVAIWGTVGVVGASYADSPVLDAGLAYVFDATTGQQMHRLFAADGAADDHFGTSVAVYGTTAIVGAPANGQAGFEAGAAYTFSTVTGRQRFKLVASDAAEGDLFGFAVAISGTTAIIGSPYDSNHGVGSGSAYLFNTATGQQLFKLTAGDGAANDSFGRSVAISGTTAVVGAWGDDDDGSGSGSAYLFDTTTGHQIAKLRAADAQASDFFGWDVSISGTTVLIGAYSSDDAGPSSGSAYLFSAVGAHQQIAKLTALDAAADDHFGFDVSISGTTALVGAPNDDDGGSNSGSAYVFDAATGQQIAKLTASDAVQFHAFGFSVAAGGTSRIVGARYANDAGTDSGSAYLFLACVADLTGDGVLDFFDVQRFLSLFADGNLGADFAHDGVLDFFDVLAYLGLFADGCP